MCHDDEHDNDCPILTPPCSGRVLAELSEDLQHPSLLVACHPSLPRLAVANSEGPGYITTYSFPQI